MRLERIASMMMALMVGSRLKPSKTLEKRKGLEKGENNPCVPNGDGLDLPFQIELANLRVEWLRLKDQEFRLLARFFEIRSASPSRDGESDRKALEEPRSTNRENDLNPASDVAEVKRRQRLEKKGLRCVKK
jgi:hypothetical protein